MNHWYRKYKALSKSACFTSFYQMNKKYLYKCKQSSQIKGLSLSRTTKMQKTFWKETRYISTCANIKCKFMTCYGVLTYQHIIFNTKLFLYTWQEDNLLHDIEGDLYIMAMIVTFSVINIIIKTRPRNIQSASKVLVEKRE